MKLFPEVASLRRASRQMVRELGFLDDGSRSLGVTHSQCHALIELGLHGTLTSTELADRLNLDKASTSRAVAELVRQGYVSAGSDGRDRRRKPLRLTAKGHRQLSAIDQVANAQVQGVLALLSEQDRAAVLRGLSLYARALARLRLGRQFRIRPIRKRDDPEVARIIRTRRGRASPSTIPRSIS